jgi:hypothetical protein
MTKIAIEPNPSGTGRFTIAAPNSDTNRTITLPDNTGTVHLNQNAIQVPAGSAAAPSLSPTDDPNTGIFFPTADTMAFAEGGTEIMRITANGNVGIGTTSPVAPLDVAGNMIVGTSGGEGGEISLRNPDGTTVGGTIDIAAANIMRIFQVSNNSSLQIGQLIGTGGMIRFFTQGSERMRLDATGNLQFNSGYGSVATAFGCRAWVNFNGTGTVAIRASGNVSSITDNGVGSYTVNFTTAMPDANYAAAGGGEQTNSSVGIRLLSTTSLICEFWDTSNVKRDASTLTLAVFR